MKLGRFVFPRSRKGLRRFSPERAKAATSAAARESFPQAGEKVTVGVLAGIVALFLLCVGPDRSLRAWLGTATLLGVGGTMFVRYLFDYRRAALGTLPRVVSLALALLLPLALARGLDFIGAFDRLPYLPLALVGLVLSIAWSRALAFDAVLFMSGLVGLYALTHPAGVAAVPGLMIALAGGLTACLAAGHPRRRLAVIRVGTAAGLVQALVAAAFALTGIAPLPADGAAMPLALLALQGLATGLVVSGSLPVIEGLFRVTTDVSLLELGNTHEQPLLRKLLLEAPGTFHHSYIVGLISEAAAEAVGGNALLTRVGALYHDVGKLNKPGYFIENDPAASGKHKALTPEMSTLIISSHPRDGIEIGSYYGLPQEVLDFMPEHHGTSCIEYFYHAARKLRGDEQVHEEAFRYPGPRPQRIETAIVMIADAVEAIARQMKEPTQARIREMVHEVAMKRLMDRQFDECAVTLQQLERIEEAITRVLAGIYHTRQTFAGRRRAHPLDLSAPIEERRASAMAESAPKPGAVSP